MACEPYRGWVGEAALGALAPRCEAELRAHLEGCAACRAELERVHRLLAAIDRGIEASLAAEPSPDFAARVGRRLAEESAGPRAWVSRWTVVAAGALAVLALVAVWRLHRGASALPTPARTEATEHQLQRRGSQVAQSPRAGNRAAGLVVPKAWIERPGRRSITAGPHEPEVLVPPGQWPAIVRFQQAVWGGRVDVSSFLEEPAKSLELEELKIPPLELAKLDVEWKPREPTTNR